MLYFPPPVIATCKAGVCCYERCQIRLALTTSWVGMQELTVELSFICSFIIDFFSVIPALSFWDFRGVFYSKNNVCRYTQRNEWIVGMLGECLFIHESNGIWGGRIRPSAINHLGMILIKSQEGKQFSVLTIGKLFGRNNEHLLTVFFKSWNPTSMFLTMMFKC